MLISELAKKTGISTYTLRYYENFGLFKGEIDAQVKTNKYKHYDEDLVEKIALIKEAKEIGFTLKEIKDLLANWYSGALSAEKKIEVLGAKIKEIDTRINQFKQVRKLLIKGIEEVKNGYC